MLHYLLLNLLVLQFHFGRDKEAEQEEHLPLTDLGTPITMIIHLKHLLRQELQDALEHKGPGPTSRDG